MRIVSHRWSVVLGVALMLAVAQPALAQINVAVETFVEADGVHSGGIIKAALRVSLPKGYHVNSNVPLDEFLIPTKVSFEFPDGIALRELVFPEAMMLEQGDAANPLAVFEEKFAIGIAFDVADSAAIGDHVIQGTLNYQACDASVCYMPAKKNIELAISIVEAGQTITRQHANIFDPISFSGEKTGEPTLVEPVTPVHSTATEGDVLALLEEFTILRTFEGFLSEDDFLAEVDAAESGEPDKNMLDDYGPVAIVAIVLFFGLGLNLTPCVLPMMPINLAIIGAGAQGGSRARGFALGGAYGLAMALVYGVLGLIVILTAGTFGTLNSAWWFNAGIAALFVVLALGMFDVIAIDFSKLQSKFNLGSKGKGTFLLAFGMGAVAALLAGACVAPIVIGVVVHSSTLYAQGVTAALLLPFLLGLGMALPWPFAGGGLSFLPKPGAWMVRVKQAFGVFILIFAAYYGQLGYSLFVNSSVTSGTIAQNQEKAHKEGWFASMTEGLETAKANDQLVFVDMWAIWCKNCTEMDKKTFNKPEVIARLDPYAKIEFQAEDLNASPNKEILKRFGGVGLPTYAILRPKAATE